MITEANTNDVWYFYVIYSCI